MGDIYWLSNISEAKNGRFFQKLPVRGKEFYSYNRSRLWQYFTMFQLRLLESFLDFTKHWLDKKYWNLQVHKKIIDYSLSDTVFIRILPSFRFDVIDYALLVSPIFCNMSPQQQPSHQQQRTSRPSHGPPCASWTPPHWSFTDAMPLLQLQLQQLLQRRLRLAWQWTRPRLQLQRP